MKESTLYITSVAGLQKGAAVVGCHLASEGSSPSITRFMFLHNGGWGHWFDIEDVVYTIGSGARTTTDGKANVTAMQAKDNTLMNIFGDWHATDPDK